MVPLQDGDLATLLKKRGGKLLSEDEIMLKFVQICLGLMHVHNKVAPRKRSLSAGPCTPLKGANLKLLHGLLPAGPLSSSAAGAND